MSDLIPDIDRVRARIAEIDTERLALRADEVAAIEAERQAMHADEYGKLQRLLKALHVPVKRGPRKPKGGGDSIPPTTFNPSPTPLLDRLATAGATEPEQPAETNGEASDDADDGGPAPGESFVSGLPEPANVDDAEPTADAAQCNACNQFRSLRFHPCPNCRCPEYRIVQLPQSEVGLLAQVDTLAQRRAESESKATAAEPVAPAGGHGGRPKRVHPPGPISEKQHQN